MSGSNWPMAPTNGMSWPPRPTSQQKRPSPPEGGSEGRSKRLRTSLACESCRNRKSRCDGARPMCTACSSMGLTCVYRHPTGSMAPRPRRDSTRFAQMERRLRLLEERLQSDEDCADRPDLGSAQRTGSLCAHDDGASLDGTRIEANAAAREDTADSMGTMTFAGEDVSQCFGPSSNSAFVARIVRRLMAKCDTSSTNVAAGLEPAAPGTLPGPPSRPNSSPVSPVRSSLATLDPYFLPPEHEILRLANTFFGITGLFFPYIHKSAMIQTIQQLNRNISLPIRKSWLCLLNAIMACGTGLALHDSQDVGEDEKKAHLFFRRAMDLSPWRSNCANLETVQALVVMTQYSEGTSPSAQTWRLHGHLVAAAFQMGLHIDEESPQVTPAEREIRRRTWYTVVALDRSDHPSPLQNSFPDVRRILSSTLGRPALIQDELTRVALPSDLDSQSQEPHSFSEAMGHDRLYFSLFIQTININRIVGEIVREVYNQNLCFEITLSMEELLAKVLKFDQVLHDWEMQLESQLSLLNYVESSRTSQLSQSTRPQIVLTLRYLNARALLYRAVLTKYLERSLDESSGTLQKDIPVSFRRYLHASIDICSELACETLNLLARFGETRDLLPSWWFTLYYVIHSALIIFGAIAVAHIDPTLVYDGTTIHHLNQAAEIIEKTASQTQLARRCTKYLTSIIQACSVLIRGQQSPAQAPSTLDASALPISSSSHLHDPYGRMNLLPAGTDMSHLNFDQDFEFLNLLNDVTENGSSWL